MRLKYFTRISLFFLACATKPVIVFSQLSYDKIVQINGVVMTSDSLYGVPDVVVSVKNQNKGTYTSELGVFALVCFKGDTLQFRSLGYTPKDYVIPQNIKGNSLSLVQMLSQDTFFLNETIIHALPSKEHFNFAFQNLIIDDDKYEVARKNTDLALIRMLSMTTLPSGRENQQFAQQNAAYRAAYSAQQQPMNILSPIKWGQFIEAWKRGDFRNKKANSY
ncbi:MAG: carboxypeptidase-like regulatory domain-containing protein [Phycisphaerales bacterium]|nr:carboxypeptidase-like regulatory domain-containing protein [Phycisphaerales bacterium]